MSSVMHDCLFKLMLVGADAVGKTCLSKRVMTNEFEEGYNATIGT